MTQFITTHFDLLVVVAMASFMAVLGGISLEDALRRPR